jgi:8-oxo-dGTP pyrophosphatase MutT (NUDIX family)
VTFSAVLDTNVLYPFSLRDTPLRLAELELYTPLWSAPHPGGDDAQPRRASDHRRTGRADETAMREACEEAEVDAAEIDRLEPAMTNDEQDRHVLAAAVAADAELIVTFDLDDFPPEACEPFGVEAIHPDDFLLDLHDLNPDAVRAALHQQAADLHPRWQLDELLRALTTAGVPRFADAIRAGA